MLHVCEKVLTWATMCVTMKQIGWLMKKLVEENETFNANVNNARRPPRRIHQAIMNNKY